MSMSIEMAHNVLGKLWVGGSRRQSCSQYWWGLVQIGHLLCRPCLYVNTYLNNR